MDEVSNTTRKTRVDQCCVEVCASSEIAQTGLLAISVRASLLSPDSATVR